MFCFVLVFLEFLYKMSILFLYMICSGICCDFYDLLFLFSIKVFIFINFVFVFGDSFNMGVCKREVDVGFVIFININLNICLVSNDGGICGCLFLMKSCLIDCKEEYL